MGVESKREDSGFVPINVITPPFSELSHHIQQPRTSIMLSLDTIVAEDVVVTGKDFEEARRGTIAYILNIVHETQLILGNIPATISAFSKHDLSYKNVIEPLIKPEHRSISLRGTGGLQFYRMGKNDSFDDKVESHRKFMSNPNNYPKRLSQEVLDRIPRTSDEERTRVTRALIEHGPRVSNNVLRYLLGHED